MTQIVSPPSFAHDGTADNLLHHMVAIGIVLRPRPGSPATEVEVHICSGFIISVEDQWFLITAGHVFAALDERLKMGAQIEQFRLIDGLHDRNPLNQSVPIEYPTTPCVKINEPSQGVDIGCMVLRPAYRALLEANGVHPVDESRWDKPAADCSVFLLAGCPSAKRTVHTTTIGDAFLSRFDLGISMLSVHPVSAPSQLARDVPEFYATVPAKHTRIDGTPEDGLDIMGMSGGPIFALAQRNGSWEYWAIAIQSRWLPQQRVLAAGFIKQVAIPLREYIRSCAAKMN